MYGHIISAHVPTPPCAATIPYEEDLLRSLSPTRSILLFRCSHFATVFATLPPSITEFLGFSLFAMTRAVLVAGIRGARAKLRPVMPA